MELQKIVAEKTSQMIQDGTIEKIIQDKLESTIKDAIDSALQSYSDFGKGIKEKISASINCSLEQITIPQYNKFIVEVIEQQFGKVLQKNAVEHLSKLVSDIIEPVEKTCKFSELIEKVREAWEGEARQHGHEYIKITEEMNDKEDALEVTFHHPEYEFYNVRATFYNHRSKETPKKWHIGYLYEDNSKRSGKSVNGTHALGDVEHILFKYYCMRTEFENDTEFEDIYIGYD